MLPFDGAGEVRLVEDTHQYFDSEKQELTSLSRVLDTVLPDIDWTTIKTRMAEKEAGESGGTVQEHFKAITADWKSKAQSSIDWGNRIHNGLEGYLTIGSCEDQELIPLCKKIGQLVSRYYRYFPESVIYHTPSMTAGTSDLPLQRQKGPKSIWDFADYKTNEAKGIYFDSIKKADDGSWKKHYNQFLKPPVAHLEYCNYNTYSLQLSTYAYMAEQTFGITVGKLFIIFIGKDLVPRKIPVAYLRNEAKSLIDQRENLLSATWSD